VKCSDCVRLIAEKLAGTLPADELEGLESHLRQCQRCRGEEVLQTRIIESLARKPEVGLSAGFTQRVMARAQKLQRARRAVLALTRLAPAFGAAAVIVLILVFRIDVGRAIVPAMEAVAQAIAPPLVWSGEAIVGAFAQIPTVEVKPVGDLGRLGGSLITMLGGVVVACMAVFWAFSKVVDFMRN
jgi:anti-sigma factor RsiW